MREHPRTPPILYPHRARTDRRFPTPRAGDQSRHARNRGWLCCLLARLSSLTHVSGALVEFQGLRFRFSEWTF